MKKILLTFIAFFFCLISFAETVDNGKVINMLQKGYSTPVIINFIESADEIKLSSDIEALDALMAAGADSSLIEYIQKASKNSNQLEAGFYWFNTGNQPMQLEISPLEKRSRGITGKIKDKVNNIGESIKNTIKRKPGENETWLSGEILASPDFKPEQLDIPGEHSSTVVTTTTPVFRFIKPSEDTSFSDIETEWYYNWLENVKTPAEFQLIKLETKGKGDKAYRQFPSKLTWSKSGFTSKDTKVRKNLIGFKVNKIKENIYEIHVDGELEPGEYVFFYKDPTSDLVRGLCVFDFSVE